MRPFSLYRILILFFPIFISSCIRNNEIDSRINSISLSDKMVLLDAGYKEHFDGIDSKVKLIVYYDSIMCSSCAIKNFYVWHNVIDFVESISSESASVIFIFAPKRGQIMEIKAILEDYAIDYPVYIDTSYITRCSNPKIPRNGIICLTDETGSIIVRGDPRSDKNLWEIYKEKIINLIQDQ